VRKLTNAAADESLIDSSAVGGVPVAGRMREVGRGEERERVGKWGE